MIRSSRCIQGFGRNFSGVFLRCGCTIVSARGASRVPVAAAGEHNSQHHQRRPVMQAAAVGQPVLIDGADWEKLAQHLRQYDEQRETVIKRCRDVTKLSKQAIYSLHRGDTQKANQQIASAESIARELLPIVEAEPTLRYGSYAGGIEEWVEACVFRTFLAEDRLLKSDELPLANVDEYLGGVLDFTGELNRYAVKCATVRDVASVAKCTGLVDALMGEYMKFDFRNSALRRKFDALKYTLKKLENTMYELSLAEATGRKLRQGEPEPTPGCNTG